MFREITHQITLYRSVVLDEEVSKTTLYNKINFI